MSSSTSPTSPRYFAAFDALRLLGAGLVTGQHALTLLRKDHHTHIGNVNIGQLGVALFMGLSGFLAWQTRRPPVAWMGQRLLRLFPAYWIAIAVSFLLAGLVEHKHFGLGQVASQMLGIGVFTHPDNLVNSPTWFISMLLVCYLGVFLIRLIANPARLIPSPARQGEGPLANGTQQHPSPELARTLPGGACEVAMARTLPGGAGDEAAPQPALVPGLIAMVVAVGLSVWLVVEPKMAAVPHSLTFAVALALAALLPGRVSRSMLAAGLVFLFASWWRGGFIYPALTLLLITAALHLPAPPRLVHTLAACTYEYYLVHGVALFGVIHFLRRHPVLAVPVGILLACVAAAALRKLVAWLLGHIGRRLGMSLGEAPALRA